MAGNKIGHMLFKRNIPAALIMLLLLSMLFTSGYIAAESVHDCSGEDCPVCVLLSLCEQNIRTFKLLVLLTAVVIFLMHAVPAIPNNGGRILCFDTPVSLKIQLNN